MVFVVEFEKGWFGREWEQSVRLVKNEEYFVINQKLVSGPNKGGGLG